MSVRANGITRRITHNEVLLYYTILGHTRWFAASAYCVYNNIQVSLATLRAGTLVIIMHTMNNKDEFVEWSVIPSYVRILF